MKCTRCRVIWFMDGELVVNQMNRLWRLKNDELRGLFHEVKERERAFEKVVYQHVKRATCL